MKTRLTIPKFLILLFSAFATTAVFGQVPYVWTNQASPRNMASATTWSPALVPNPTAGPDVNGIFGDEMQWDGRTTNSEVDAFTSPAGGQTGASGNPVGLTVHLTGNQTNPVVIYTTAANNAISPGIRIKQFIVDAGAGALHIGDGNATNLVDFIMGGVNGQLQGFTNNSTTAATIAPNIRWRMGGAGAHTYVFEGTGDWIVNNPLRSQNQSAILVTKPGTGNMFWNATNTPNPALAGNWGDALGSPLRIDGGNLIMKSYNVLANQNVVNNALLTYDAGAGSPSAILPGNFTGSGNLTVSSGTLNLQSQNSTFSGNITLNGGELVAGGIEIAGASGPFGVGGLISFTGGTLGYSANNGFDYSPRFTNAANQAVSIDTAGSIVQFGTSLNSVGGTLTLLGGGILALTNSSSYSGLTTVNAGKIVFTGSKLGTGNIFVNDGAALGVTTTGTQVTPASLIFGTNSGATLEFNKVSSLTVAPLAPTSISTTGQLTININSGTFPTIGLEYPLLWWTNGVSPGTNLGIINGAAGYLFTNGNTLNLHVTETPYIWTGLTSSNWDLSTPNNWVQSAVAKTFVNQVLAVFDDSSAVTNVNITGIVAPRNLSFNNNVNPYSITNSTGNNIGGTNSLTMNGNSTLILPGGANTYTGPTTLNAGLTIVNVLANGGVASDLGAATSGATNWVFNGGSMQYNGPSVTIDRLFSIGPFGGTIDNEMSGALSFSNPGPLGAPGGGPRSFTFTGPDEIDVACGIVNGFGPVSVRKQGTGLLVLTGTNSYSGGTTIANGTVQVGANGATGSLGIGNILNNSAIDFKRTSTVTVPGNITGVGSNILDGAGIVVLSGDSTYSGGTFINAGTLQLGDGVLASGSLNSVSPITNNSLLVFNNVGFHSYSTTAIISGPGNVRVMSSGTTKTVAAHTYTGTTYIDTNAIFWASEGQTGTLLTPWITNNGILRIVSQDGHFTYNGFISGSGRVQIGVNNFNVGAISILSGTNTYTGGTFIGGDELQLGDGSTTGAGAIAGNVSFVNNFTTSDDNNRILNFVRPDSFTFGGNIVTNFTTPQNNQGQVYHNGGGTLTLTGNNSYGGGTLINGPELDVGNGGGTGSLGTGNVTNNSILVFNRSGSLTVPGLINGSGEVRRINTGTLTLSSALNTYGGATTISNGTLIATSVGTGNLNLEGGTIVVQGTNSVANLNVGGNMNIDSGTVVASINKALVPSNTSYTVTGVISNGTGNTLHLYYVGGPVLVNGDKFFIFNQGVTNGDQMTIVTSGFSVANHLRDDGSVTVTAASPLMTQLTNTYSVGLTQLNLSWDPAWIGGAHLQGQTNRFPNGLNNSWGDIAGTAQTNIYTIPVIRNNFPTNGSVFFRLAIP